MTDEEMSKEMLLEHYRNPHNYGRVENPSASMIEFNPVCGDTVQITIKVENGIIVGVKFIGRGCSISQGSASMLTEKVLGISVEDAKKITQDDILEMLGMTLGPSREKCAILSLNTLQKCIRKYEDETGGKQVG